MAEEKKPVNIDIIKFAAEYFYAESLRQMNANRLSVNLPLISTTQGRKLHADYMKQFYDSIAEGTNVYNYMYGPDAPKSGKERNNRVTGQMMASMGRAFSDTMLDLNGGQRYYNLLKSDRESGLVNGLDKEHSAFTLGYESSKEVSKEIVMNFIRKTGWQLGYAEDYAKGDMDVDMSHAYLPMSPYDETFSMKRTFLDNGGRILWGQSNDFISGAYTLMEGDAEKNLNLYSETVNEDGVRGNMTYAGKYHHADDVSGLSRLRPYMSDAEYKSVQPTIEHDGVTFSPEALEKSVAILQWLTDNGYTYTISNDTNPGQLKARIGNSKMDIRIMDIGKNEKYIGRCYEDGYETYYLSNAQMSFTPNTEDIIRMISYTLGNTIERVHYNAGEMSNVAQKNTYGHTYYNKQLGVKRETDDVGKYAGEVGNVFWKMDRDRSTGKVVPQNIHQDGLMPFDKESGTYPNSQVLMDVRLSDGVKDTDRYAKREYAVMAIRSRHHASHEYFEREEEATAFLQDAIRTSRTNYLEKLDIDRLIDESVAHAGEVDYIPELSYDPEIAPIQLQYWEVLTGKRDLYKAGMTSEEVYDDILAEEEMSDAESALLNSIFGENVNGQYEGTLPEQVQQHVQDTLELEFGSLEPSLEDGMRFNPWNVSKFMTSSYGQFRNNDNVVEAMKKLDIPAEELRGSEFQTNQIKDKLIKFNPETAVVMGREDASPFMKTLAKTIQDTITTSHCVVKPEDILIDDNEIVHYTAQRLILNSKKEDDPHFETVEGHLGQIFEPDMDGVVETQFNGSQNQLFSPGYLAYVLPQEDGESKSLPERVRLKGYTQVLQENIKRQLRSDLLDPHVNVGTTTNVNNSYRGLYESRYKVHGELEAGETLKDAYIRECRMTGLQDDAIKARFASFKGMVRLPSSFKEDSSLNAAFAHSRDAESAVEDLMNDNARDAWQLSGGENISVLSEHWDGYTDRTATGSAKNQGVVRYLVEGATVDEEGRMHPARKADGSIDTEARTPLMSLDIMKYVDHTPFDRQQMVFSNLSGASGIDNHTGVATMTMGGYTFDDGAVISAAWAEKNGPLGEDGVRRPIGVGDKILDCAGNKSIVGKVIDPDMSTDDFDKLSTLEKEMVVFFHDNPEVSVVMSPYSPMSRFNATSARFAMEDNFEIQLPDGSTTYGGYMPMIVTDKTVDEKTKEYGEEAVKAGGGRSASGQFNWILSGVGAFGLMDECYGNNESALANYREYLITMGMDMDETGTLRVGYEPHVGEDRHYFQLPELDEVENLSRKSVADMFRGAVDNRGGFLEVPIQMELPSGEKLQPVPAEKSNYVQSGVQTYALPIMSSYLRSGQEFQDGTSMTHDYTNHYAQIYAASVEYMNALHSTFEYEQGKKDDKHKVLSEEAQKKAFDKNRENTLRRTKSRMVSEYKEITSDVEARIFTGKHNYVRDHLMSARLPHSATAVWTAEPNCDIDEIRMPSSMAKTLGKQEGEMVLGWRDPCLHRTNLAGLRVTIDDSLVGVAVNPLMASRMDGDFDGDSIGLYGVQSKAGLKDLNDKLAMHNTLLDMTHRNPETGDYALFINTKMDVRSLYARDEEFREQMEKAGTPVEKPSLRDRFTALEKRANDIYQGRGEYAGLTFEEKDKANRALCNDVSKWTHDVFESYPIGAQTLSMESPEAYLKDLQRMADTKAKGKAANIDDVAKYFGMTYEKTVEGGIDYSTIEVKDHTLATRQDMKDTEYAVAVKANGTPLGGQVSLNFAELARNLCLIDGLDLTYNATQAVLQAKHDPVMAKQQYGMLQGALKSMWRGHKLESHMEPVFYDGLDESGNRVPVLESDGKQKYRQVWTEVKDEKGRPVPLNPKQWVDQFMEIHESKDGMNLAGDVNREQVEIVANALKNEDGYVYNIEGKDARELLAAPMDRLAYQPKLQNTIDAAQKGECIFEGSANEHLAPKIVRENLAKMRAFEAEKQSGNQGMQETANVEKPDYKSFGKSDTLVQEEQHGETGYRASSRFVGENKKGVGSVVLGGFHEPKPMSLQEQIDAQLGEGEYEKMQMDKDSVSYSQKELAEMYPQLDETADEQLISEAALAYQNRDELPDDEDDIDNLSDSEPLQVTADNEALRVSLAEKSSSETRMMEDVTEPSSGTRSVEELDEYQQKIAANAPDVSDETEKHP